MVSGTIQSWTVARRVDDPARGRSEKAIFPSGHDSSLLNAGVTMTAVVVIGSASAASGILDDAIAVDIAAMLDRKFRLFGFVGMFSVDSCVVCFAKSGKLFLPALCRLCI